NWFYLGTGFLVLLAVWLAKSGRMYLIGNGMGAKIKLRRYFQIYMATCFISHVTPFNSGGTPLQIYLLHRQGIPVGKASAITAVDLGINTIIFFLLGSIAIIQRISGVVFPHWLSVPVNGGIWLASGIAGILPAMLIGIFLVAILLFFWNRSRIKKTGRPLTRFLTKLPGWFTWISQRINNFIQKKGWSQKFRREYSVFKEGWRSLANQNPGRLIWAVFLTAIYWFFYLSLAPLVMVALGKSVSFISLMGEQLFFNLVQIFIPTPGGSGGSELIMSYLFRGIAGEARIGWFVLLWKIYTFFSTLIIGGYFFIRMVLVQGKKE
ncbi:MAG TPA: lysylphosphatidylglycerol synthase transmembrane domain-containing protein, partial [Bacillota bacterium]|nr:lysylphosphatidylglycerol synthase transmembrane domain-containing protein [Bacillota bacterium]